MPWMEAALVHYFAFFQSFLELNEKKHKLTNYSGMCTRNQESCGLDILGALL